MTAHERETEHYFSKSVNPRMFKVGDLVLKETEPTTLPVEGKLGPRWEGPYVVTASHESRS